jgi:glycosyltransferase involved in cell wall biosynthesis
MESREDENSVAWIVVNMVSYHHARAVAFSSVNNNPTHVIEITNTDVFETLAHESQEPAPYFRHTLLPGRSHRDLKRGEAARALKHKLSELRPSVVCLNGWSLPGSWEALLWARRRRIPVVVMSESTSQDAQRTFLKEWIKRRYIAMCGAALVGGERHRDYLVALGMPASRVFFGYDVVDNGFFASGAAAAYSRAQTIVAKNSLPEKFFLASARFTPKKNLETLLRAYHRYRVSCLDASGNRISPWGLVLLGDGPLRSTLVDLIARLKLRDSVNLPGFKSYRELPEFYGLAQAFVHASTVEQWGLVVNEAMASGLPLLLSRTCGCAPSLLREGENGYGFDPSNIDEIAGCMRRITICSPEMRRQMGNCSQDIIRDYGPAQFAEGMRQAVRSAAAGYARGRLADGFVLRAMTAGRWLST